MIVSYLDEDLLIIRDPFGSPEVLKRKSMDVRTNMEYSVDDMGAPSA